MSREAIDLGAQLGGRQSKVEHEVGAAVHCWVLIKSGLMESEIDAEVGWRSIEPGVGGGGENGKDVPSGHDLGTQD